LKYFKYYGDFLLIISMIRDSQLLCNVWTFLTFFRFLFATL